MAENGNLCYNNYIGRFPSGETARLLFAWILTLGVGHHLGGVLALVVEEDVGAEGGQHTPLTQVLGGKRLPHKLAMDVRRKQQKL